MVCLGYFLTVSCEKNVDFFKNNNNQHFLKNIFDWSEFPIRLVFVIFKKIINIFFKKKYLTGPNREFVYYCKCFPKCFSVHVDKPPMLFRPQSGVLTNG